MAIDPSGKWMNRWNKQFQAIRIPHLRSMATIHPDPRDQNSLISYAFSNGRKNELIPIKSSAIGRHAFLSKRRKQRERQSSSVEETDNYEYRFFLPGTKLFGEFCDNITKEYQLENKVYPAKIELIDPLSEEEKKLTGCNFRIYTSDDKTVLAEKVVLAIGNCNTKRIPNWVESVESKYPSHLLIHSTVFMESPLSPSLIPHCLFPDYKIPEGTDPR
jgi:hypothetical protein